MVDKLTKAQIAKIDQVGEMFLTLQSELEFIRHFSGVGPETQAELIEAGAKMVGFNAMLGRIVILANHYRDEYGEELKYVEPSNFHEPLG